MVISHGLWQRRFGGDSSVVGSTLIFDTPNTIVGVAPPGFQYPARVEMWVPLQLTPDVTTREYQPFSIVARLRPGASIEAVQRDAATYVREIEAIEPPGNTRGLRAVVLPFEEAVLGDTRASIEILFAGVVLLLLLAWSNVANLLLMRASARSGELALRSALGADPGDLMRPLLAEAALLALAGAALALPMAYWALTGLIAVAPPEIPRLDSVRLGLWAPACVVGLAALTVLVVGLGPAAWSARLRDSRLRLGSRGGGVTPGGRRARSALVVFQVGLALLLTAGAAVLAVSLRRLSEADMGFAADRVTLVKIGLPDGAYDTHERHLALFDALTRQVAAAPGVLGVTPVVLSPFTGPGGWDASFVLEGQDTRAASANPTLNLEIVAPGYFEALGIPLHRGRWFDSTDRSGSMPVAIVSQRLARRLWAGADPVGKRIKFGGLESDWPWLDVVGVVGDTRYRELTEPPLTVYIPFAHVRNPGMRPTYLAVRSERAPGAILGEVRTAARGIDAGLLVPESASVSQLRAVPLARPRLLASLAGAFAMLALGLAAVGVYGMVAVLVVQRTHEFGVRIALGVQSASVRRLVLGQAAGHAAVGVLVGLVAWLGASRVLRSVLYGVTPTDPVTLAAAAGLLLAAAVAASYFPARRATRVDPALLLRSE
jgi:predicted permease